ncbi:hypothetical protein TREES_T100010065 [Tupaia chinensis]|uniref:Uncharacterized protein n=1 Tax=Tupaia chinensis TaxID=246437 RepID=L9KI34_TUPCH|nr:hypothetical protein TREES_T100010065 [Tupaia chinensis]
MCSGLGRGPAAPRVGVPHPGHSQFQGWKGFPRAGTRGDRARCWHRHTQDLLVPQFPTETTELKRKTGSPDAVARTLQVPPEPPPGRQPSRSAQRVFQAAFPHLTYTGYWAVTQIFCSLVGKGREQCVTATPSRPGWEYNPPSYEIVEKAIDLLAENLDSGGAPPHISEAVRLGPRKAALQSRAGSASRPNSKAQAPSNATAFSSALGYLIKLDMTELRLSCALKAEPSRPLGSRLSMFLCKSNKCDQSDIECSAAVLSWPGTCLFSPGSAYKMSASSGTSTLLLIDFAPKPGESSLLVGVWAPIFGYKRMVLSPFGPPGSKEFLKRLFLEYFLTVQSSDATDSWAGIPGLQVSNRVNLDKLLTSRHTLSSVANGNTKQLVMRTK